MKPQTRKHRAITSALVRLVAALIIVFLGCVLAAMYPKIGFELGWLAAMAYFLIVRPWVREPLSARRSAEERPES